MGRHASGYEHDEPADGDANASHSAAGEGEMPVDYDWQAAVHDHLAREADMLHSDPGEQEEEDLPLTGLATAERSSRADAESHDQPEAPVEFGDDYIAAARMAAQVAAESGDAESEAASAEPFPTSKPKRSGFSLPFFKRRAKKPRVVHGMETSVVVAGGAPTKDAEVKRKRLILAALLVLAAVSAFTVRGVYEAVNSKSGAKAVPERVEQKPRVELGPADPSYRTAADLGPSHARRAAASADPMQTSSLGAVAQHRVKSAKVIRAPEDLAAARLDALPQAIGTDALREAALKGNPIAQFVVATRFFGGQNVDQNHGSAVRWYKKAAEQGLAPAQYRLATLLERGKGIAVDLIAARHWYEEAARKGNVRAMHNLAVLLINGASSSPDYVNAAFWFRSAADHGLKDSQYNLAILCERGYGVQQDEGEAFFWYSIAARDGDADAAQRARVLGTAISEIARQEVEAKLKAWHAKDIDPAANAVAIAEPSWQAGLVPPPMPGNKNPVAMAQVLLDGLGLAPGPVDGKMGSGTARAIRHFQLKSALPVDGQVTPALLAKLQDAYGSRLS